MWAIYVENSKFTFVKVFSAMHRNDLKKNQGPFNYIYISTIFLIETTKNGQNFYGPIIITIDHYC